MVDVSGDEGDQPLRHRLAGRIGSRVVAHLQHALRAVVEQSDHPAQRHAVAVDHLQADQVDPVVLAFVGSGKAAARHEDAGAAQRLGGVAIGDVADRCHHIVAMGTCFGDAQQKRQRRGDDGSGSAGLQQRRAQIPAPRGEQRLGILGIGLDADPALDAPGIGHTADFDGIGGELGVRRRRRGRRGSHPCRIQAAFLACSTRRVTVGDSLAPTLAQ